MTTPQESAWLDQEDTHLSQLIRAHRWAVQYMSCGPVPGELVTVPDRPDALAVEQLPNPGDIMVAANRR